MTFRPTDISPHGHFFRWNDISHYRHYAPWAFLARGRLALQTIRPTDAVNIPVNNEQHPGF